MSETESETGIKISELYIYNVREEEEDSVFYCSGRNAAGTAKANFTLTVSEKRQEAVRCALTFLNF